MKKNCQELFWKGRFGNKYTKRNYKQNLTSRFNLFSNIFYRISKIKNVYEIGTNIGQNLDAIKQISRNIKTYGIEINDIAYDVAKKKHNVELGSIFNSKEKKKFDFVLTRGLLIHINPKKLNQIYKIIYNLSKKYILIDEYFSPKPEPCIRYRGYKNVLFKRDFAKELMKKYSLELIDYGFTWKEDAKMKPLDSSNWFLFKKKNC